MYVYVVVLVRPCARRLDRRASVVVVRCHSSASVSVVRRPSSSSVVVCRLRYLFPKTTRYCIVCEFKQFFVFLYLYMNIHSYIVFFKNE